MCNTPNSLNINELAAQIQSVHSQNTNGIADTIKAAITDCLTANESTEIFADGIIIGYMSTEAKELPSVQAQFNILIEQWEDHCRANSCSSDPADYLNKDIMDQMIQLGPKVLPFIQTYIEQPVKHEDMGRVHFGLSDIIEEITQAPLRIPSEKHGNLKKINDHIAAHIKAYLDSIKD